MCPDCAYAAYPDDFATLAPDEVAAIQARGADRDRIAGSYDVNNERTLESALIAFRLAIDSYAQRAPNYQRMGGVYHRLAWLAREAGDASSETAYLTEALKQYMLGWEKTRPTDPTTELMMLYTIGDLNLRLGSAAEAVRWLHQASQHAAFKNQPEIQRLTRERWGDARATARPR